MAYLRAPGYAFLVIAGLVCLLVRVVTYPVRLAFGTRRS